MTAPSWADAARDRAAALIRPSRPVARARSDRPDVLARAGMLVWAPVWLGCGIGLWFALPSQPAMGAWLVAGIVALAGFLLHQTGRRRDLAGADGTMMRLIALAVMLASAGFGITSFRAAHVQGPVLTWRYYGAIEGRLVELDRSGRDRLRLTLDQVRLARMGPAATPHRVRVSLADMPATLPDIGTRVMLTGHLGPPPGPSEPRGFDFRRAAWFDRIGAVGYTRTPVMVVQAPEPGLTMRLNRLRMDLSRAMQDRIGGQAGAVASALMTGDRSGIAESTNEMMRASNLYHIVSISGLHMGMLAGFVFAAMRLGMVGAQAATRRGADWPVRKIAALSALAAATAYLWLSGGGVATERAYIMVAVMLGAILADRRAISLRTVAVAALVILVLAPEALLSPGFQMSFAATVALILSAGPWARIAPWLPPLLRPVAMLVVTSLVAGIATSPIAAVHFGRMAHYGMLANLLVVPVMGVLVMPMGVIAALLAPVGLAQPALWAMKLGTQWMLAVGGWVASLDGAVTGIAAPPPAVLPILAAGGILAALSPVARTAQGRLSMRGLWRHAAAGLLIAAGLVTWAVADRPAILIGANGDAVAIMTDAGRVPSKPKGGSFVIREWLVQDGDMANQETAAARSLWSGPMNERVADPGGGLPRIVHLTGRGSIDRLARHCRPGTLVIIAAPVEGRVSGGCDLRDTTRLARDGAVALWPADRGGELTAVAVAGARPWVYERRKQTRFPGWQKPETADARAAGQANPGKGQGAAPSGRAARNGAERPSMPLQDRRDAS